MANNNLLRTMEKVSLYSKYNTPAPCGDGHCLNGPPDIIGISNTGKPVYFETYAVCDVCIKKAPDPYDAGVLPLPLDWKLGVKQSSKIAQKQNTKRKNKAANVLAQIVYSRHLENIQTSL